MISRYEYLYTKSQIKKLDEYFLNYEIDSPIYKEWQNWLHKNIQEQEEELSNWDKYDEKCRNSYWGKAFFSLYPLFKSGQFGVVENKVKEIVDWEKNNPQPIIEKPNGIDPKELKQKIGSYYELKTKLEQFRKIQAEYSPVYEKQSEQDTL